MMDIDYEVEYNYPEALKLFKKKTFEMHDVLFERFFLIFIFIFN